MLASAHFQVVRQWLNNVDPPLSVNLWTLIKCITQELSSISAHLTTVLISRDNAVRISKMRVAIAVC